MIVDLSLLVLVILSSAFNMSKRKNLSPATEKHEKISSAEVLVTADNCADFIGKLVVLTEDSQPSTAAKPGPVN